MKTNIDSNGETYYVDGIEKKNECIGKMKEKVRMYKC